MTAASDNVELQAATSRMVLYLIVVTIVPMIIACPIIGSWSDRYSRKYPVLLPLLGGALAYGWWAVQAAHLDWHPAYMLVGGFLQGMSGYFTASSMTSYSYLTAVIPAEARTFRIAIVEGTMSVAAFAGSFASGAMLENISMAATCFAMAAANLLATLYCLVWLDDVRTPMLAQEKEVASFWSCASSLDYLKCVFRKRSGYKSAYLHSSLIAYFVGFCGITGASDLMYLFLTKVRGFSPTLYGYYAGSDVGLKVTVGAGALLIMRKVVKLDDLTVALCGCLSGVLGYGLIGVSVHNWTIWVAVAVNSLQFVYVIGVRSFLSSLVDPCEQGRIFAFMASGQSVFIFTSAVIFNNVYPESLRVYPGMSFIIASGLCFIGSAILAITLVHRNKYKEYEEIPGICDSGPPPRCIIYK